MGPTSKNTDAHDCPAKLFNAWFGGYASSSDMELDIQLLVLYTLIRLVPTCTGSFAGEVLITADNDWPPSS